MEENYKIVFSEVYDILKYTDDNIKNKISSKFMEFIDDNRDKSYKTNVIPYISLENQFLLDDTKAMIALIYRKYIATDEEKTKFSKKDQIDLIEIEKKKIKKYNPDKIFENSKLDKSQENTILPIARENPFIVKIKCLKEKILNFFFKNKNKQL